MRWMIFGWLALLLTAPARAIDLPRAVDERLAIELFAAEPDIVTPTGLAVEGVGRVLVIESHTHFRPQNYQGPPADRIRRLEDTNGDGRADRFSTFFEGSRSTMGLAIDRRGNVLVATRGEVFRLADRDGNGQADERTPLVRLETKGDYPHNGLSGFAFDAAGNLYFGMGENLGVPYRLIGSDGSSHSGSEGGHIFRCDPDGGHVERYATGFWNPFHLAFDAFGRLFAVDNDPDALPPCRLVHVVPGGNYGYKFRNGRRGLHPFTAWNGELPGTLPMVAGTGEAPSGIVEYRGGNLPHDYVGELLVTSWGDHRLEWFKLERRGASFKSMARPFVSGGENFRPVAIAAAPDGALFVSDWVDKSYEVHGKGRIWLVRAKDPATANAESADLAQQRTEIERRLRPVVQPPDQPATSEAERRLADWLADASQDARTRAAAIQDLSADHATGSIVRALSAADLAPDLVELSLSVLPETADLAAPWIAEDRPAVVRAAGWRRAPHDADAAWRAAADPDPFVAQAARAALGRMKIVDGDFDPSPLNAAGRLAALLVLRESQAAPGKLLKRSLRDPDPQVRFAAVQWVGEERLLDYRPELDQVLAAGPVSGRLFAGLLAAQEKLDRPRGNPNDEWAGEQYVAQALQNAQLPAEVRRWALRVLRPDHPLLTIELLRALISGTDPGLQLEAVRSLRENPAPERLNVLAQLAADSSLPPVLRAEAVVGLPNDQLERLLALAADKDPMIRNEALRALVGAKFDDAQRRALKSLDASHADSHELIARLLGSPAEPPPAADDLDAWLALLAGPADAAAGERVFFSSHAGGCARCHAIEGRGARIGPELTAAAPALDRRRLLESILLPSKEVAPRFVTWTVETSAGRVYSGMLVREENGSLTLANERGELSNIRVADIVNRVVQNRSSMPDGLERGLTLQEFRDLLAFLARH